MRDKQSEHLFADKVPSHVKGMGIHIDWAELQPGKGDSNYFDWSYYNKAFKWAADHEVTVYLKIYPVSGRNKPSDVFQNDKITIGLAFNGANPQKEDSRVIYEWIKNNTVKYGLKPSDRNARGTNLHGKRNSINWYNPRTIDPDGDIIFAFNEFGGSTETPIALENDVM